MSVFMCILIYACVLLLFCLCASCLSLVIMLLFGEIKIIYNDPKNETDRFNDLAGSANFRKPEGLYILPMFFNFKLP